MTSPFDFPVQQGYLDYLCGPYALINLLNIEGEIEDIKKASNLFKLLITSIHNDRDGRLDLTIKEGLPREDMPWLFEQIGKKTNFRSLNRIEPNKVIETVKKGSNALILLWEKSHVKDGAPKDENDPKAFSHYTVVRDVTSKDNLILHDSYSIRELLNKDEYYDTGLDGIDLMAIVDAWILAR